MNEIEDAVIVSETPSVVESTHDLPPPEAQMTEAERQQKEYIAQRQMQAYAMAYRQAMGASKRKKGCTTHKANPAGTKLARKLARQGSLYKRLSLVDEMFIEIGKQNWLKQHEGATV